MSGQRGAWNLKLDRAFRPRSVAVVGASPNASFVSNILPACSATATGAPSPPSILATSGCSSALLPVRPRRSGRPRSGAWSGSRRTDWCRASWSSASRKRRRGLHRHQRLLGGGGRRPGRTARPRSPPGRADRHSHHRPELPGPAERPRADGGHSAVLGGDDPRRGRDDLPERDDVRGRHHPAAPARHRADAGRHDRQRGRRRDGRRDPVPRRRTRRRA